MSVKNIEKFKQLLVYIVNNYNNNDLYETKLWKLIYFCDADYFEKNRKTITGINYYKNTYGPTPDKNVVDLAIKKAKDFITIDKYVKNGNKKSLYRPKKMCDLNFLTADEIEEVRKVCEKYFRLSTNDIIILAHKDTPYLGSKMGGVINFKLVDYRDEEYPENEDCDNYQGEISDEAIKKLFDLCLK